VDFFVLEAHYLADVNYFTALAQCNI
jgi:hypothetical protein